jgi:hypothetical protein
MAEQARDPTADGMDRAISEVHTRANRLNVKIATGTGEALIQEARQVAKQLTDYVRTKVADYDDFVKRVELSEEFSLTESRQVAKIEQQLKVLYLRAASLLEAASEAEARGRRKRERG